MSADFVNNVKGTVADVVEGKTIVEFRLDDKDHIVLVNKNKFYHCGKIIPQNDSLAKYLIKGVQVEFSAIVSEEYGWEALVCWNPASILDEVTIKCGLNYLVGVIQSINKSTGVLESSDTKNNKHFIAFDNPKVYIEGEALNYDVNLENLLKINDLVSFDAIPCIPEESNLGNQWKATVIYKGKRPENVYLTPSNIPNFFTYLYENSHVSIVDSSNSPARNCRNLCLNLMNQYINPQTLFVSGKGIIFHILNDEFGLIMGTFRKNMIESIIFHRKFTTIKTKSLASADLTQVFRQGDKVQFIAVGAPPNFIADWIAAQVNVLEQGKV